MKNKHPFYSVFEVLKVLIIICKMQPLDLLFLVVFYSSTYHFSIIFRASYNIWKIDCCHEFSFFNGFTQTPHPLNSQNLLSMTNVFCQCPLKNCIWLSSYWTIWYNLTSLKDLLSNICLFRGGHVREFTQIIGK